MAPPERIGDRLRRRVRQHGQYEALGVPERVAVVPRSGKPLGCDRTLLRASAGLEYVEERETDCLLKLGVPVELDVCAIPEVVEVLTLGGDEPLPACVTRLGQRRNDEVAHGG